MWWVHELNKGGNDKKKLCLFVCDYIVQCGSPTCALIYSFTFLARENL